MSNDNERWQPNNDQNDSDGRPGGSWHSWNPTVNNGSAWGGSDDGASSQSGPFNQSPEQGRPFGYFQESSSQWGGNQDSSGYGQFGTASGDYGRPHSPYTGSNGSPFPLHPLAPMEQIDAAIRLIRFNPAVFVVLPIIVYLVVGLLSAGVLILFNSDNFFAYFNPFGTDYGTIPTSFIVSILVVSLLSFIASLMIYTTAVNGAMSAVYGRKISIGRALSMSVGDSGRLAVAYVLYTVCFTAVMALFGFVLFPILSPLGDSVVFLVFLALFFGGIYLAIRVCCVVPALVAEQRGPIDAVLRSFQLTKGRAGTIFVTFVVTFIFMIVLSIVLTIIASLINAIFTATPLADITYSVTSTLISSVLIAFAQAVSNVIYVNLRMERENFHHQVRNS